MALTLLIRREVMRRSKRRDVECLGWFGNAEDFPSNFKLIKLRDWVRRRGQKGGFMRKEPAEVHQAETGPAQSNGQVKFVQDRECFLLETSVLVRAVLHGRVPRMSPYFLALQPICDSTLVVERQRGVRFEFA